VFGFGVSIVISLIIWLLFSLHHVWDLIGWWLQEFVDLRLSLVLNRVISTLSATLTYGNSSTSRVVTLLTVSLDSWLWSIWSRTWRSTLILLSFVSMLDVFALNILEIDLFFLFLLIDHIFVLPVDIIALSSFVSSNSILILILISFRILRRLIIVALPSRIPLFFVLLLMLFFVLFNLILIHFYIISSILSRHIRIGWLLSSMMKSSFLFNWLFLIFELLLSLIIEIIFLIFFWFRVLFFVTLNKGSAFWFSFLVSIVFYFTSYFCVVDAFKILLNCLFTVFGVQSLFNVIWL